MQWIAIGIALSVLPIVVIVVLSTCFDPPKREISAVDFLYHDQFVEIYQENMVLNGYWLGPWGRKTIPFDNIDKIELVRLDAYGGRYRIQGTGDFTNWFTHDHKLPWKDTIFIVHRKQSRWRIGFSAEDVEKVAAIFASRGIKGVTGP